MPAVPLLRNPLTGPHRANSDPRYRRPVASPGFALWNNFEGGSNTTTLTAGSGGNTASSGSFFDAISTGATNTCTFSTTQAAHGSLGLHYATNASNAGGVYVQWSTSLPTGGMAQAWTRFYLYTTATMAANEVLYRPVNGSTILARLQLTTGRALRILDTGSTVLKTFTNLIPLNQWVRIEMWCTFPTAATASYECRLFLTQDNYTADEVQADYSRTANFASLPLTSYRLGLTQGVASQPDTYMDEVALNNYAPWGPASTILTWAADNTAGTGDPGTGTDAGESIKLTGPVAPFIENTAEGGTNTTTVSVANSGGSSGTAFDAVNIGANAALTYDNAQAAHGSLSIKAVTQAAGSLNAYYVWQTSLTAAPVGQAWFRVYGFFSSYTGNLRLVEALLSNSTLRGYVSINNVGKPTLNDANAVNQATAATALPTSAWWRLEGYFIGDPSAGAIQLKIFRTNPDSTVPDETLNATSINTGGTLDTFRFGNPSSVASYTFWMDEPGGSIDGYLGPYAPSNEGLADSATGAEGTPTVHISDTEAGTGTDASTIAATLSSPDTGSGLDAASILLSGAETGTGTEASTIAATLSATETGSGAEAAIINLSSPDTGSGLDAGSASASFSDTETGSGLDAGTIGVSSPDTANGTDAGESIAATLSSPDTGSGAETATIGVSSTDTGSSAEGTPAIGVSSADTGSGAEAQSVDKGGTTPSDSDTGTGADGGESTAATLSSADTGSGAEASTIAASLSDTETGSGTEGSPVVHVSSSDTGNGAEASLTEVASADTGSGAEGTVSLSVSSPDLASGTEASSIAATLSSPDAATGTEGSAEIAFSTTDSASGTEGSPSTGVPSGDNASSTETGAISVQISTADTGSASEGASIALSATESASGAESVSLLAQAAPDALSASESAALAVQAAAEAIAAAEFAQILLSSPDTLTGLELFSLLVPSGDSASGTDTGLVIGAVVTAADAGVLTDANGHPANVVVLVSTAVVVLDAEAAGDTAIQQNVVVTLEALAAPVTVLIE